jgi:hypothetical protein
MWARLRYAGLLAIVACYNPPEPDCGFVCGPSGECPADYACAVADNRCHRNGTPASLTCSPSGIEFGVTATAPHATQIVVTFSDAPEPNAAAALGNYTVTGLQLTGTPTLAGNAVTIATAPQAATMYTVVITNVTRASDGISLTNPTAKFTGIAAFDVMMATAATSHSIAVTFDAAPDPTLGTTLANYSVSGLTLSGTPMLASNTVTIATSAQTATALTVTVSNVTRAADAEPLTTASAMFTGRVPFDVTSAQANGATSMQVTFDAAPEPTSATTLGNYNVPGLLLSGTPTLAGNVVTITTAAQTGGMLTVTVSNVTRAADAEPLTTTMATFTSTNHCTDLTKDGDETDTDCGGPTCVARCASGKMCVANGDCTSNVCQAGNTCM